MELRTYKVTNILYSIELTDSKYKALEQQAAAIAQFRKFIWQEYGSIKSIGINFRALRDQWVKEKRTFFGLSANTWKEVLALTLDEIALYFASVKQKMNKDIFRKYPGDANESKRKEIYKLLNSNDWVLDRWLSRIFRKYWHRGHSSVNNQIIVKSDDFTVKSNGNRSFIAIPSMIKGKRIRIPLTGFTHMKKHRLMIILKGHNLVEIHFCVDKPYSDRPIGNQTLGGDMGYTEVFWTCDNNYDNAKQRGEKLGPMVTKYSDEITDKHEKRNKLRSVAKKKKNKTKKILKNNLGTKKQHKKTKTYKNTLRDIIATAINEVFDDASTLVVEDLSGNFSKKDKGSRGNRLISMWSKGFIRKLLTSISQHRSSVVKYVNAAYTSQVDSRTGLLQGKRVGDLFYCVDGVVLHADINSAINILARDNDDEIQRYTKHFIVKNILLKRGRQSEERNDPTTAPPGLQLSTSQQCSNRGERKKNDVNEYV